jgi:hypothetical protein
VFAGAHTVTVEGPDRALPKVLREGGALRVEPALSGAYRLVVDGVKEVRVAMPVAGEYEMRPRAVAPQAMALALGGGEASVDASWVIALVLLALVTAELVVRAWTRGAAEGGIFPQPASATRT